MIIEDIYDKALLIKMAVCLSASNHHCIAHTFDTDAKNGIIKFSLYTTKLQSVGRVSVTTDIVADSDALFDIEHKTDEVVTKAIDEYNEYKIDPELIRVLQNDLRFEKHWHKAKSELLANRLFAHGDANDNDFWMRCFDVWLDARNPHPEVLYK